MRTLEQTALGPLRHRIHLYLLAQSTVHVSENCGRWSGYHDDGMPMICNRRAGHFGRSHYDSMNGLIWRSGEEPRDELTIIDDLVPLRLRTPPRPSIEQLEEYTATLILEQRIFEATAIGPDAFTYPGADGSSTFNGRPIIDGARPGLVFYIEEPTHEQ